AQPVRAGQWRARAQGGRGSGAAGEVRLSRWLALGTAVGIVARRIGARIVVQQAILRALFEGEGGATVVCLAARLAALEVALLVDQVAVAGKGLAAIALDDLGGAGCGRLLHALLEAEQILRVEALQIGAALEETHLVPLVERIGAAEWLTLAGAQAPVRILVLRQLQPAQVIADAVVVVAPPIVLG